MIFDLPVRPGLRILVTSRPVDFRRGMDSLSTLVKETLAADLFICVGRQYVAALRPQEANSAVMMGIAVT